VSLIIFLAIGFCCALSLLAAAAVLVFLAAIVRSVMFAVASVRETRAGRRDRAAAVARNRWRSMWRRRG